MQRLKATAYSLSLLVSLARPDEGLSRPFAIPVLVIGPVGTGFMAA
jgi:hypothetical protein